MSTFFLDTSALIKHYVVEQGHAWMKSLCDRSQGHQLFISQVALIEVVATLCRKAREQSISISRRDALIDLFSRHRRKSYEMVRVTNAIYLAAGNLCRNHKLRAYDAIQMACALAVRADAVSRNMPVPMFVCADSALLAVAAAEGMPTDNPNNHP